MLNFDFQSRRTKARAGMVEWNTIFRLFRFSGILSQPREVLPKFRNEIPENVYSIRSPTRNFRNFWSNGKRPKFPTPRAQKIVTYVRGFDRRILLYIFIK